jgi:hypothetical protein
MSRLLRVDELVSQVRSQIDEENQDTIDDIVDILPALNRAQNFAMNILARHYEDPLLKVTSLDVVSGQVEYDIPEDAFEDRLEKVEMVLGKDSYPLERLSYRDISNYETSFRTNIPSYYTVIGRKIRLTPTPSGSYDGRIWYLQQPEELILPIGRITKVNTADNYVILDSVATGLTTEVDKLASYVNLVDGQTGRIKCSMQVRSINGNRINFKSSPLRSEVDNRTIESDMIDLPDLHSFGENATVEIQQDDYLCAINGSCVLYFRNPTSNFIIQYAVAEMKRKTGGAAELEERILDKFEQQVERSWVGREQQLRVKKKSKNWDRARRRWPYSQG